MTKTPPTKPPLPPLRERLKLSDRFVDVTDQHIGEVFVLTNPSTWDGSVHGEWIKKSDASSGGVAATLPEEKPDDDKADQ